MLLKSGHKSAMTRGMRVSLLLAFTFLLPFGCKGWGGKDTKLNVDVQWVGSCSAVPGQNWAEQVELLFHDSNENEAKRRLARVTLRRYLHGSCLGDSFALHWIYQFEQKEKPEKSSNFDLDKGLTLKEEVRTAKLHLTPVALHYDVSWKGDRLLRALGVEKMESNKPRIKVGEGFEDLGSFAKCDGLVMVMAENPTPWSPQEPFAAILDKENAGWINLLKGTSEPGKEGSRQWLLSSLSRQNWEGSCTLLKANGWSVLASRGKEDLSPPKELGLWKERNVFVELWQVPFGGDLGPLLMVSPDADDEEAPQVDDSWGLFQTSKAQRVMDTEG
jgi:hypothetical protein